MTFVIHSIDLLIHAKDMPIRLTDLLFHVYPTRGGGKKTEYSFLMNEPVCISNDFRQWLKAFIAPRNTLVAKDAWPYRVVFDELGDRYERIGKSFQRINHFENIVSAVTVVWHTVFVYLFWFVLSIPTTGC